MNNSDSSMTTTDNLAKVVATQDLSEIIIKGLAEKLSAQIDKNRRLIVENHILWNLLLFQGLGLKWPGEPPNALGIRSSGTFASLKRFAKIPSNYTLTALVRPVPRLGRSA
jgi:hypothetical protein